jgi:hypothetical protein
MTSVIQRMVARATGETSASLRPRRPARFESFAETAETGFSEAHIERVAHAAPASAGRSEPSMREPAARALLPDDAEPPPEGVPATAAAMRIRATALAPSRPSREGAPLLHASAPPAPNPLLPETMRSPAASAVRSQQEAPATGAVLQDFGHADHTERRVAPRAAPESLLALESAARLAEALTAAAGGQRAARDPAARADTDQAAEPEITIHIGRLDIRADSPKRAELRRVAKPRSLPPLSDYLRGGR